MLGSCRSLRFVTWFNAWLFCHTSLDDARDRIVAPDAVHQVVGLPGSDEPVPLVLALGRLRNAGATRAALSLPDAGDPVGLAGPAAFTEAAVDAGEAVLLPGSGLGAVPEVVGSGVLWRLLAADPPQGSNDVAAADRELRQAFLETLEAVRGLDPVGWPVQRPGEGRHPRRAADLLAPGYSTRAVRLAASAGPWRVVTSSVLSDPALASGRDERRAALRSLDRAVRRALIAACADISGPGQA
jgi:hypothetical protein